MKGKKTTVAALQEAINKRLGLFAGRKYEGAEFHAWYAREIAKELEARGITELRPCVWGVAAMIEGPSPLVVDDRIAEINIEFKRDKRYRNGPGRGVILGMEVVFPERLTGLTLEDARKLLLEDCRAEQVAQCRKRREKAIQEAAEAETLERMLARIEI